MRYSKYTAIHGVCQAASHCSVYKGKNSKTNYDYLKDLGLGRLNIMTEEDNIG